MPAGNDAGRVSYAAGPASSGVKPGGAFLTRGVVFHGPCLEAHTENCWQLLQVSLGPGVPSVSCP